MELGESKHAPVPEKPRIPRRLALLLGLLLLALGAYAATGPLRQRALVKADLLRHEVRGAEQQERAARDLEQKRRQRLVLLEQLAQRPEDPVLLRSTASLYAQDRQYDDAVFLLQEARRIEPENVESYRALFETHVSQGVFDRAYDYASEGLKHAPRDMELVLALVHLDSLVGWNAHARAMLRRLEGTPEADNPRARIASALIYRQVTDSRHAVADLTAALSRDPRNDKIYALLSGVQWESGQAREAEASIRKALEIQPENPDYLLHLAEIQLRRRTPQDVEASRKTAEQALRADPGNRNAFFAIAQALLAEKKTEEAREVLEKLLARYPDHPHAGFQLAKLYSQSGKQKEAERLLQQYAEGIRLADSLKSLTLKVAMLPDAAAPHAELGRLYNDTGAYDKAVLVLRRALQLDRKDIGARRQLARALTAVDRAGEYSELAAHPEWHVSDGEDREPSPGAEKPVGVSSVDPPTSAGAR